MTLTEDWRRTGGALTGSATSTAGRAVPSLVARRRLLARAVQGAAVIMGGALVDGCGTGGQPAGSSAAGGLKGTIRLYGWDQEPISGTRRRAMDGFREKHPTLTVEQETTSAGGNVYFDKLQTLISSDSAPDMFIIQDSWQPFFLKNKLALNLDPLVRRDKYDLADFPKGAIDSYRHQGGLYGLPDNITSHGFFVNLDLFKQAGVQPPPTKEDTRGWTFDALLQRLQQLTNRLRADPPVFGIAPNYSLQGWLAWVRSNGGDLLAKDGSATALDSAAAMDALQFLADLRHKYQVAPTAQQMQGTNPNELFERGRLAIHEICVCQVARFRQNAQFDWDAAFRPAGRTGLVDHLFAFPQLLYAGSKHPDAAWAALKWFEDEGMKVLVEAGALQGTKMNAHQRAVFVDAKKKPANAGVWVTSVEKFGRTPPATTNWSEVDAAIAKELTPLFNGERTARDSVQAIKQTVDPLVKAGQWS
jgi:multiple sugar transport system substrate-binding protein